MESVEERINQCAIELKQAASSTQRETLRAKLIDQCLKYRLKISSVNNDAVEAAVYAKLKADEKFDGIVFCETIQYCVEIYVVDKGSFLHLFNYTLKKRLDSRTNQSYYADKYAGMKSVFSEQDKKIMRDFEKITKTKFSSLIEADIKNLCSKYLVEELQEKILQLWQRYNLHVVSMLQNNQEGEEYNIIDYAQIAATKPAQYGEEKIFFVQKIFEYLLKAATEKQKLYFTCFITITLCDEYGNQLPKVFLPLINQDFVRYAKSFSLKDKDIVDFFGTDKSNVSKYRARYQDGLERARKIALEEEAG